MMKNVLLSLLLSSPVLVLANSTNTSEAESPSPAPEGNTTGNNGDSGTGGGGMSPSPPGDDTTNTTGNNGGSDTGNNGGESPSPGGSNGGGGNQNPCTTDVCTAGYQRNSQTTYSTNALSECCTQTLDDAISNNNNGTTSELAPGVELTCAVVAQQGYSCTDTTEMPSPAKEITGTDKNSCCESAENAMKANLKAKRNVQINVLKGLTAKAINPDTPAGLSIQTMPNNIETPTGDGTIKITGAEFSTDQTDEMITATINELAFKAAICSEISDALDPTIMKITIVQRRLEQQSGRRLEVKNLQMQVMSDADIDKLVNDGIKICGQHDGWNANTACTDDSKHKFNIYGICANSTSCQDSDLKPPFCCKPKAEICATMTGASTFCPNSRVLKTEATAVCTARCGPNQADIDSCCKAATSTPPGTSNSVVVSAAVAFVLAFLQ